MFAAISYCAEPEGIYFFDVWGTGTSEGVALEDAKKWAAEFGVDPDLEILEIDHLASEHIQSAGGGMQVHGCQVVDGRVKLMEAA